MSQNKVAADDIASSLQKILELKSKLKELEDTVHAQLANLPKNEGLILKVAGEYRTLMVGKPDGVWVRIRDLDLIRNAKTTDKDKKYYGLH